MAKNTASRDLMIYMDTHNTLVYSLTKFHVNKPKYLGFIDSCCCSPSREK